MERKKIILPVFNSIFWLNYGFFFHLGTPREIWARILVEQCVTLFKWFHNLLPPWI